MPRHSSKKSEDSHHAKTHERDSIGPSRGVAHIPQFVASSVAAPTPVVSSPSHRAYGGGRRAHDRVEAALHKLPEQHQSHRFATPSRESEAGSHGQAPPASSLPGTLPIIGHPSGGRDHNLGIAGILRNTSIGPESRQRMVSGIIQSGMDGRAASGPVHEVLGRDATAYNAGMVHIRGSGFV